MAIPRSLGSRCVTSTPPISTVPASKSSSPAIALSKVDFPQPDGPSSTAKSPGSTTRSIPRNARTGP